ncbi:hypothetical protein L1887_39141 [Cichorium endivia]|nr:hypothetical protein L1887_39141 [Cichorium endivia]
MSGEYKIRQLCRVPITPFSLSLSLSLSHKNRNTHIHVWDMNQWYKFTFWWRDEPDASFCCVALFFHSSMNRSSCLSF